MSPLVRLADRALPALLVLLLLALLTSITAVGVVTALLVLTTLARLTDPAVRARYRVPLAVPLGLFVGLSALSAALSARPVVSLLYLRHLHLMVLFVVAVNEFRSAGQVRRALAWFFPLVVLVSVYAILQTVVCASSLPVPGWVGWLLRVKLEACRATGIEPFRAKGFFSIYMTLGGSLVVALSLLLASVTLGPRPLRPAIQSGAAVVALALTYVRNAWLGVLAALVVLVALSRRWTLLAIAAVLVVLALATPTPIRTKITSIFDPASPSVADRLHFWAVGGRMLADAPLLGQGPGSVKWRYPEYRDPGSRRRGTSHLHNNFVQVAAERGLLGVAAWSAIWAVFLAKAARTYAGLPVRRAEDRALVAGSLAAVVGFLVAGLFEYSFGDAEVIGLVWVVMAFPFVVQAEAAVSPTEIGFRPTESSV